MARQLRPLANHPRHHPP